MAAKNSFPLNECSISDIFLRGDGSRRYVIPIYQRNYAWGLSEIEALINDVCDSLKNDVYYIGTLVTFCRGNGDYEVIDGQQRLTTIYLILKALGEDVRNTLTYTARPASAAALSNPESADIDEAIKCGYKVVTNVLDKMEPSREEFTQYFLERVHIIHYTVPQDVDLNHYFEVMNSRGEQLEKHEIVKSLLGKQLSKSELPTFSRVWEACSEMNVYIQQRFNVAEVFGGDYSGFIVDSFDKIQIPVQDGLFGTESIEKLLERGAVEQSKDDTRRGMEDRFQPIIDFPNFLLIVLKLTLLRDKGVASALKVALDDKELLKAFNEALKEYKDSEREFAKLFAYNLLKARYFLDNYVVHHDTNLKEQLETNPWKLQRYKHIGGGFKPENLSADKNVELVHLLSMFEVSYTAHQRKNYLLYTLRHLFESSDVGAYLEFLRDLADSYYHKVYLTCGDNLQPAPGAFDEAMLNGRNIEERKFDDVYKVGSCAIPLYIFNYTDYKLWRKYAEEMRGEKLKEESPERLAFFDELGCTDFSLKPFQNFYFSRTRKSLEHYYPQAKAIDGEEDTADAVCRKHINCFGNFAMIGAEVNSSGSNWSPKVKLDHYGDSKIDQVSVASLKFRIMMQKCRDNTSQRPEGQEWLWEDMKEHHKKMLAILSGTLSE